MFEAARDGSTVAALARRGLRRFTVALESSRLRNTVSSADQTQRFVGESEYGERTNSKENHQTDGIYLTRALTTSRLGTFTNKNKQHLEAAFEHARVGVMVPSLRRVLTASFCYRWLTAEPEPDVIVIDLRETRTAGSAIAVLDRTLRALSPGVPTAILTDGLSRLLASTRERPLRVCSLIGLAGVAISLSIGALSGMLNSSVAVGGLFLGSVFALGLRSSHSLEELRGTRLIQLLVAAFEPPEPPTSAPNRNGTTEDITNTDDSNDACSSENAVENE